MRVVRQRWQVLAIACTLPFSQLVSISMLFYGATTLIEARDHPRPPETTRDYPRLLETTGDVPDITRDFPRSPETTRDYPRLPEIDGEHTLSRAGRPSPPSHLAPCSSGFVLHQRSTQITHTHSGACTPT